MGVGKSQAETTRLASPPEDSSALEEIDPLKVPADLFGIIFRCSEKAVPWKSLLAHAVAIREPLLAIVAVCEKVCAMCVMGGSFVSTFTYCYCLQLLLFCYYFLYISFIFNVYTYIYLILVFSLK